MLDQGNTWFLAPPSKRVPRAFNLKTRHWDKVPKCISHLNSSRVSFLVLWSGRKPKRRSYWSMALPYLFRIWKVQNRSVCYLMFTCPWFIFKISNHRITIQYIFCQIFASLFLSFNRAFKMRPFVFRIPLPSWTGSLLKGSKIILFFLSYTLNRVPFSMPYFLLISAGITIWPFTVDVTIVTQTTPSRIAKYSFYIIRLYCPFNIITQPINERSSIDLKDMSWYFNIFVLKKVFHYILL